MSTGLWALSIFAHASIGVGWGWTIHQYASSGMKERRLASMRLVLLALVLIQGFYAMALAGLTIVTVSRSTIVASLPLSLCSLMVLGAVSTLFCRERLSRGASRQ